MRELIPSSEVGEPVALTHKLKPAKEWFVSSDVVGKQAQHPRTASAKNGTEPHLFPYASCYGQTPTKVETRQGLFCAKG